MARRWRRVDIVSCRVVDSLAVYPAHAIQIDCQSKSEGFLFGIDGHRMITTTTTSQQQQSENKRERDGIRVPPLNNRIVEYYRSMLAFIFSSIETLLSDNFLLICLNTNKKRKERRELIDASAEKAKRP